MSATAVFWPCIALALVTLYLYIPMSRARVAAVKSGRSKAEDYRLIENEPPEVRQFTNAIRNQYETPILFYAACVMAFVTGQADTVMIVIAWAYGLAKLAHVYVHATSNRLRYRRPVFMVAFFILILMWVVLSAKLALA